MEGGGNISLMKIIKTGKHRNEGGHKPDRSLREISLKEEGQPRCR